MMFPVLPDSKFGTSSVEYEKLPNHDYVVLLVLKMFYDMSGRWWVDLNVAYNTMATKIRLVYMMFLNFWKNKLEAAKWSIYAW